MIKLLKHMDKLSYLLIFIVIGLVVLQVYSDLELPSRLQEILNTASKAEKSIALGIMTEELRTTYRNDVLRSGLEMFGFALITLTSSILVCLLAARIAAKFSCIMPFTIC